MQDNLWVPGCFVREEMQWLLLEEVLIKFHMNWQLSSVLLKSCTTKSIGEPKYVISFSNRMNSNGICLYHRSVFMFLLFDYIKPWSCSKMLVGEAKRVSEKEDLSSTSTLSREWTEETFNNERGQIRISFLKSNFYPFAVIAAFGVPQAFVLLV